MKSFKLSFEYPWRFGDNYREEIKELKKFPRHIKYIESTTFGEISLYFNGKLYTPRWETRPMNFSDTVYLLNFFKQLVGGINNAKERKKQRVWFIDNPTYLEFRKENDKVTVWIDEDGEKTPQVIVTWKAFVKECKTNAKKFLKIILAINTKLVDEPQVKLLSNALKRRLS